MADPTTINFGQVLVLLGNGATPEVFSAPCGFTDKAVKNTAASSAAIIPDCDNPEAAPWSVEGITSLSLEVTGSGILALEDDPTWQAWFDSGASKNVRIVKNMPAAQGGGYRQGPMVLTDISEAVKLSSDAKLATRNVTIKSAGPMPWTANAF
jgi:hypothetical protein